MNVDERMFMLLDEPKIIASFAKVILVKLIVKLFNSKVTKYKMRQLTQTGAHVLSFSICLDRQLHLHNKSNYSRLMNNDFKNFKYVADHF